jgi:hypothetical protein
VGRTSALADGFLFTPRICPQTGPKHAKKLRPNP